MPVTPPERPDVIPCEADPDYECVRIDSQTAGGVAHPPSDEPSVQPVRQPKCPDGYVPRRRRVREYRLEGKRIQPTATAERNPLAPPKSNE
jgi:hypothetical protein